MAKISEMDTVIRELHTAADTIKNAANSLAEMFGGSAEENTATADTPKKELTLEEVSSILMPISRMSKAHSDKLRTIIQKYGATKLSAVDPVHYEDIISEAEVIRDAE